MQVQNNLFICDEIHIPKKFLTSHQVYNTLYKLLYNRNEINLNKNSCLPIDDLSMEIKDALDTRALYLSE